MLHVLNYQQPPCAGRQCTVQSTVNKKATLGCNRMDSLAICTTVFHFYWCTIANMPPKVVLINLVLTAQPQQRAQRFLSYAFTHIHGSNKICYIFRLPLWWWWLFAEVIRALIYFDYGIALNSIKCIHVRADKERRKVTVSERESERERDRQTE